MAQTSNSAFVSSLQKKKGLTNVIKKFKKAVDENAPVTLKPGKYNATLVSARASSKDGKDEVNFRFQVTEEGRKHVVRVKNKLYGEKFDNGERTEEESWDRFSITLQRLGVDVEELETPADIEAALETLSKDKPTVSISVQPPNSRGYVTVYINGLVEAGAGKDDDEEEEEDDEDSDDSDSEESEEESDDDEDGEDDETEEEAEPEEPEVAVARKDQVNYKPKGAKKAVLCNVTASNPKAKTCDLLNVATKSTYKGIAWGDVQVVEE